jgi:hypothetical protein
MKERERRKQKVGVARVPGSAPLPDSGLEAGPSRRVGPGWAKPSIHSFLGAIRGRGRTAHWWLSPPPPPC